MFWDSLETREASAAEAAEETLEIARLVARLKACPDEKLEFSHRP